MVYSVKTNDENLVIKLNEKDRVTSILQNVAIILGTLQRSVPMGRRIGLPGRFVDKPINVAKPMAIVEIKEAIEEYEPRAEFKNVRFLGDVDNPCKLTAIVEVDIADE